jgi:hypothetical protein
MSPRKNSQTSKAFVSRAGWYSLRHPLEWTVEEDDTCVELFDPDQGVGALHISAYQTPSPVDPREELLDALSDYKPPPRVEDVAMTLEGTKKAASFESVSNHSFQKTWYISDKNYLVLVTYDCGDENKDKELEIVEDIVRSIELEPKISRN